MLGVFNTISINGDEIYRGNDFTLSREYIYAGEIETCTGKRCADVVGWRYADMSVEWDTLPQDMLQTILDLSGEAVPMMFESESGDVVTENVVPTVITSTAMRFTDPNGAISWRGIRLGVRFIDAHRD